VSALVLRVFALVYWAASPDGVDSGAHARLPLGYLGHFSLGLWPARLVARSIKPHTLFLVAFIFLVH